MKRTKKLISLLLAIAMVLVMSVTAFAADTTLTIKTTEGHTYKVYQLLKGDVANLTDGTGILSNAEAGSNMKSGATVENFIAAIKNKDGAELGDIAYGFVEGESKNTIAGDGTEKTVSVESGYYLVTDSYTGSTVTDGSGKDTVSRYMVAVVGPTTMEPKTSTPDIDKKIIDTDANAPIDNPYQKTDTAAIGDVIEYEITGKVPDTEGYKYYYYVVHDTLSKGLTLDENSFVVKIGGKTLTKGSEYYVYGPEVNKTDGSTSFKLALEDLKKLVDTADNGVNVGSDISIKYKATVNDDAVIGTDPNTNTAKLEYSNKPGSSERSDEKPGVPNPGTATGKGPDKTTKTYVTELTILKVDENGKKLTGAEFTLSGTNLNKVIVETNTTFRKAKDGETADYYKLKDGTYTKTAPSSAAEGEEGYNADLYESTTPEYVRVTTVATSTAATDDNGTKKIVGEVNAEGYLIFTGLNAGTYTLTETKTPTGYTTMEPIEFVISATQSNSSGSAGGTVTWSSNNKAIVLDTGNGVFNTTIENIPGSNLPSTGGTGTTIFYILGFILVAGSGILLVTRRRMKAEK